MGGVGPNIFGRNRQEGGMQKNRRGRKGNWVTGLEGKTNSEGQEKTLNSKYTTGRKKPGDVEKSGRGKVVKKATTPWCQDVTKEKVVAHGRGTRGGNVAGKPLESQTVGGRKEESICEI